MKTHASFLEYIGYRRKTTDYTEYIIAFCLENDTEIGTVVKLDLKNSSHTKSGFVPRRERWH